MDSPVLIGILMVATMSSHVQAATRAESPSTYPTYATCTNMTDRHGMAVRVKTPQSAKVNYYFSNDCSTIYVLPPPIGIQGVRAISKSANLGLCGSLRLAQKSIESNEGQIKRLSDLYGMHSESFDSEQKDAGKLKAFLESLRSEEGALQSKYDELAQTVQEGAMRADALKTRYADCRASDDCAKIEKELKTAEIKLAQAKIALESVISNRETRNDVMNGLEANLKSRFEDLEYKRKSMAEINERIVKIRQSNWDSYRKYASIEAATATVTFTSQWGQQISEMRKLNGDFKVSPMPLRSSFLSIDAKMLPQESASSVMFPAAVSIMIRNDGSSDNLTIPQTHTGDSLGPNDGSAIPLAMSATGTLHSKGATDAEVTFSLIAACPLEEAGLLNESLGKDAIAGRLVPSMTYTYDLWVKGGYRAEAKIHRIIDGIADEVRKKGRVAVSDLVGAGNTFAAFGAEFDFKLELAEPIGSSLGVGVEVIQGEVARLIKSSLVEKILEKIASPRARFDRGCGDEVWYTNESQAAFEKRVARIKKTLNSVWKDDRVGVFPVTLREKYQCK